MVPQHGKARDWITERSRVTYEEDTSQQKSYHDAGYAPQQPSEIYIAIHCQDTQHSGENGLSGNIKIQEKQSDCEQHGHPQTFLSNNYHSKANDRTANGSHEGGGVKMGRRKGFTGFSILSYPMILVL